MTFDGEHKVIPIKGIARAGADSISEDGAMNEVIGFEYKEGSYVPYAGETLRRSVPYWATNVYIHKTSTQTNILVQTDNKLLWMSEEYLNTTEDIADEGEWGTVYNGISIKDVEFIGNVVCVSADDAIHKSIFLDGQYQDYEFVVNKLPKIGLRVTLGIPEENDVIGKQVTYYQTSKFDGGGTFSLTDSIQPQLTKAIGRVREEGGLTGYFLACIAYRLTTGDIVAASAPMLLARPMNINDNKISDIHNDFIVDNSKKALYYDESTLLVSNGYDWTKGEKDLVWNNGHIQNEDDKTIHGYYKYNEKNYHAGNIIGGAPLLFATANILDYVSEAYDFIEVCAIANKLQYFVKNKSTNDTLDDLVSSVCIFISEEITPYKDWSKGDIEDNLITGAQFYYEDIEGIRPTNFTYANSYFPRLKTLEELQKEFKALKNMYKVGEISYTDIRNMNINEWQDVNTKGMLGDSLLNLDTLPISAFSTSDIFGGILDSYNSRLHVFNYKQKLFEGYDILDFTQYGGVGQFNNTSSIYADEAYIKVYGKNNTGKYAVVKKLSSIVEGIESASIPLYWNPVLSYPDKNAYQMDIYYRLNSDWYGAKVNLTQSANGGYAYNILNSERYVSYIDANHLFGKVKLDSVPDIKSYNDVIHQDNVLKVSDTYNPNYFPPANTYTIGDGSIIGIASLSISLSQDTFGQYPLLVFCTDGIYSMGVDTTGTGVYNNIAPFSREVCVNRNTICEIDGAVLFASNKGLMIATAQGVDEFIPALNGEPRHRPQDYKHNYGLGLKLYKDVTNLVELSYCVDDTDFRNYLANPNTYITYASEKNKVIVYNGNEKYIYWIDIPTRNVTKLPISIRMDNDNYPTEEYVSAENKLIKFNQLSANVEIPTMFQTRPLKIDGGSYSSLRVIVRGYFKSIVSTWAELLVLGSYDCINWQPIGISERKLQGGFNDIGCVTDRVSYKYMMIIFSAKLSRDSHIDGIEITKINKYNNKLK